MNRAFSKILIVIILVVLTAGGIFAWRYFRVPKEEVKMSEKEKLELRWEIEGEKLGIEGKIMAMGDMNNDGRDDLIIARPAQDNEEWYDSYITVISLKEDKFIPIWKSAKKYSIRDLWVGDVDNNGKNNIVVSSSTNFPEWYYYIFEINGTTPLDEKWDKKWDQVLEEAVDKYWKSLKSSSVFRDYWYWKVNGIADKDSDGRYELLVDVFFLPTETAPYSELLVLKWDGNTKSFYEKEEPYIKVLSPNGGEKWVAGETYTISWTANNIENVIISLLQGSSRAYLISPKTGVNVSLQKFDWRIDDSISYVGRNDLRIVLSDAAYCGYIDESTGVECVKDELRHGDESDNYFSIIKTIGTEEAKKGARDLARESDLRQIVSAMELYYDVEYFRSKTMPTSIGIYLNPVPKDPSGDSYHWLDNTSGANTSCDSQHYCVWAQLEGGGYFVASEKGTKELLIKPTKCPCW